MTAARRFYVTWESGRRGIVEADDSVEALTVAQREGSVQSLGSDPHQASGFRWLATDPRETL